MRKRFELIHNYAILIHKNLSKEVSYENQKLLPTVQTSCVF